MKKYSLVKNTIVVGVGKLISQVATFLLIPIYTAYLTPENYGYFDLIITIALIFVPIALLKLEAGAFRFLISARTNKEEVSMARIVTVATVVAALSVSIFVILAVVLSLTVLDIPFLPVVILYFLSASVLQFLQNISRGVGSNAQFAVSSCINGVVGLVLTWVFLSMTNLGIVGAFLGLSIAGILASIYVIIVMQVRGYLSFRHFDKQVAKDMLRYSAPLIFDNISWWVLNASDRILLSIILGVGSNGIYAVSSRFSQIYMSIFGIYNQTWVEYLSVHAGVEIDDGEINDKCTASLKMFAGLGLCILSVVSVVFPWVTGVGFSEARIFIPVLIIGVLFYIFASIEGGFYVALRKTKQLARTTIVAALVNIGIHLALINFIGIWAAAVSTAVAYGAMAVYRHYDMKKYVKITYGRGVFVKVFIFFVLVSALYYMGNLWANVGGLVVAVIGGIWLNYGLIKKALAFGIKWFSAHRKRSGELR